MEQAKIGDSQSASMVMSNGHGEDVPEDLARARREAEAAEARAEVAVEVARLAAGPGARTPELTQREREYEEAKRRHAELEGQVRARQRALAGRTRDEHVSVADLQRTLREVEDLGTT